LIKQPAGLVHFTVAGSSISGVFINLHPRDLDVMVVAEGIETASVSF